MKWNTQRKAAVALLALAGGAFLVDRFGIGYGPQAASAAAPTRELASSAAPPPKVDEAPIAPRTITLADKVKNAISTAEHLDDPFDSPDAFTLPEALRPMPKAAPEPPGAAPHADNQPAASGQEAVFTLTSVVRGSSPDEVWAHINGRLVRVGESIQGHRLDRVIRCADGSTLAILYGPSGKVPVRLRTETKPSVPASDESPTPKVNVRRS